ncbi:UNVERIFIED_ORG: hypothetical protein J2806_004446 [Kosakonia oryzae]|uniref:RecT family protein n=1 Tax=Kosakonia radicincitans TaxID=283686 RepID=A0AAX2EWE4_9ENTR|nr:hypothetical protein [Kosakonia oryzae]SFF16101.1 RecT family protein [Kosakonia radicincitans]SFR22322.1 RecT family protein [Kosakonia radicincitans]SFT99194.1 RecT family protein [Kosakonia radicincitans]SFY15016.1 RecT family protein [Kosakonia radicincitans]
MRGIIIRARLKGEEQYRELDLLLAQARVRNSTLWADDPRQQLAYLAVKRWARLFCPDVILGVYTPDELEDRQERVINPDPAPRVSVQEITESEPQNQTVIDNTDGQETKAEAFRARIDAAETLEAATAVGNQINEAKAALGTALFTELKNKATRRYHLVNNRNKVEAAINSLPSPGEPGAAEQFAAVERTLSAAKRHLGDDLYEKYSITLTDMKPEYVG